MAVEKLSETYQQLTIERNEKEINIRSFEDMKRKSTKESERLNDSIKLINNLLEQKANLEEKLKIGKFKFF